MAYTNPPSSDDSAMAAAPHRPSVIQAVILAAGISRRLQGYLQGTPKALLSFDGLTLLQRHLQCLVATGVTRAIIVTGYEARQLEEHVSAVGPPGIEVCTIRNDQFEGGSILSMALGLAHGLQHRPDSSILLMDADVLYDSLILVRLLSIPGTAIAVDETSHWTGEEQMVGIRDGRVWKIAKDTEGVWEATGEAVGFIHINAEHVRPLLSLAEGFIAEGRTGVEHEEVINDFMKQYPVREVRIGGLTWTEIDFPDDVERANRDVLPKIRAPGSDARISGA